MSADLLRRAATKARDLADGARPDHPWYDRGDIAEGLARFTDTGDEPLKDAEHIASWDPVTARAAADLLGAGAEEIERRVARDGEQILERANPVFHAMTELARTYLREEG